MIRTKGEPGTGDVVQAVTNYKDASLIAKITVYNSRSFSLPFSFANCPTYLILFYFSKTSYKN